MMLFVQSLAVLCFAAPGIARTLPKPLVARQDPSATTGAPAAQSTICGDIVDDVNTEGANLFWASDAYACLTSVPFNPAVATRFLKYWNETIQFQTTLAYLKNPPEGYQQPAIDVLAGLQEIQQHINEGYYTNQYAFEADFQLLIFAMHDAHIALTAGALSAFSFASPYEISSVSVDGKQDPKVYITDDIIDSQDEGWEPSPIRTINGEDVVEYLTKYAALNSFGNVEPHADWNALMTHPAMDIQGGLTAFSGSGTFYPGENLTFTFENGTNLETIWLAIYNEEANFTGPLTTGGDFFNYFVLGLLPESFDPTTLQPPQFSDIPVQTNWSVDSFGAYPEDPDVAQFDLSVAGGGIVTGYIIEDISTGVLSLPSFAAVSETIGNFSSTVNDFIGNASAANVSRVIIDLQQNTGGATILAFSTFKSFFPDLVPFAGSRRRSFPMANTIGDSTTGFWDLLNEDDEDERLFKEEIAATEWVITNRLNAANGNNFTNWEEYQGPINDNGDSFTLTERYDLANPTWQSAAFDEWVNDGYLGDQSRFSKGDRAWSPDQIVILTDGLCSSACSLFVEMMTREGVRTVVAGGRPSTGPMQAASGNRGARLYSADQIDDDILFARSIDEFVDESANGTLPDVRDEGIFIKFAGFNLRDQIREGEKIPLQFKYEAADCRIYYTLANLYNMTRLWRDVSAAAFDDPSLCVEGSTGYSTTNNTNPKPPPKLEDQKSLVLTTPVTEQIEFDDDPDGGLQNAVGANRGGKDIVACTNGACTDGISVCRTVPVKCSNGKTINAQACLPPCSNSGPGSGCKGTCNVLQKQESKVSSSRGGARQPFSGQLYSGLCFPNVGTRNLGCPANPKTGR
ncbi:hypothetical protein K469DRAFT_705404 [Zopfia rhizophila CBS 207.26]|uniref:Uncharacterized protein n=1 Tax=Zopfia rhizophila CBS 207.26 TaxID=1314779 RepID=A0A6A6E787_9PEZI|nr:hypothetical protein K469DRAFT_705404 [Zopfia rhizophila CBS 207.26]